VKRRKKKKFQEERTQKVKRRKARPRGRMSTDHYDSNPKSPDLVRSLSNLPYNRRKERHKNKIRVLKGREEKKK